MNKYYPGNSSVAIYPPHASTNVLIKNVYVSVKMKNLSRTNYMLPHNCR